MIGSFRHKGLRDLFVTDNARGVRADQVERIRKRLETLDEATRIDDLKVPGWRLHALHTKPVRWSIWINGPWRITFEWADGDAVLVDLEQYH